MNLQSLPKCKLAIGDYPYFDYDARGGGGKASITDNGEKGDIFLRFDQDNFSIPPLNWRTTKILGFPLPPGIELKMLLDKLEGNLNNVNGHLSLQFEARFILQVFSYYYFPELIIKTSLKTEKVKGKKHSFNGMPIQKDGKATLVGIANVPPTGNKLLDSFLKLPNEALAVLKCQFKP